MSSKSRKRVFSRNDGKLGADDEDDEDDPRPSPEAAFVAEHSTKKQRNRFFHFIGYRLWV
jgi:hypothetical protein